jgi:hypothetical protein
MMSSASSTERRNHLSFSTKAWYAVLLLSKNSSLARKFVEQSRCFSTKAWYAAFLLSKDLIIGPEASQAGPALLD